MRNLLNVLLFISNLPFPGSNECYKFLAYGAILTKIFINENWKCLRIQFMAPVTPKVSPSYRPAEGGGQSRTSQEEGVAEIWSPNLARTRKIQNTIQISIYKTRINKVSLALWERLQKQKCLKFPSKHRQCNFFVPQFARQTVPDCRASWAEAARPVSLRESSRYNDLASVCGRTSGDIVQERQPWM